MDLDIREHNCKPCEHLSVFLAYAKDMDSVRALEQDHDGSTPIVEPQALAAGA